MILRDVQEGDALLMALDVTDHDLAEFNKMQPGRNLWLTLRDNQDETTKVIVEGDNVLAMGGSKGCLWFITSEHVAELPTAGKRAFLALLKEHLEVCRKVMPEEHLTNFVSVDNAPHIRLLRHLGAVFSEDTVMSPGGYPFRQFWL